MKTKSIQKNFNLENDKIRNKIFGYIDEHEIGNKKINEIKCNNDLDDIKNNNYKVVPVYTGTPVWILFFKNGDNYYSVNFH